MNSCRQGTTKHAESRGSSLPLRPTGGPYEPKEIFSHRFGDAREWDSLPFRKVVCELEGVRSTCYQRSYLFVTRPVWKGKLQEELVSYPIYSLS